jgi:DNA-directed RNA polymerase specialized sigma subunit
MFDTATINQRFLSFFEGLTHKEIAAILEVGPSAVSSWQVNRKQVPWKKLKWLVDKEGICWDWLIEGRGAMSWDNSTKTITC